MNSISGRRWIEIGFGTAVAYFRDPGRNKFRIIAPQGPF